MFLSLEGLLIGLAVVAAAFVFGVVTAKRSRSVPSSNPLTSRHRDLAGIR